jgi:hypothetical protein
MPPSSERNVPTVPRQVKLEITNTGLVSTTNLDVMNTLKSVNKAQSTDSSTGARKEDFNKSVVLSVNNLLQPPASESVPASVRRKMFTNSTVKANCVPQTQIPATIIISSNTSLAKPGPTYSKPGNQNTHFSSSNDQPKNIRKNSKKLQLIMTLDPVKQKLIDTSDSCQSSPETPPLVKLQKNQAESYPSRPTVAQLSSKFEAGNVSKT